IPNSYIGPWHSIRDWLSHIRVGIGIAESCYKLRLAHGRASSDVVLLGQLIELIKAQVFQLRCWLMSNLSRVIDIIGRFCRVVFDTHISRRRQCIEQSLGLAMAAQPVDCINPGECSAECNGARPENLADTCLTC